ncbi:MAG: DUF4845 domain-containing protein [Pseudomonadales bacterium]
MPADLRSVRGQTAQAAPKRQRGASLFATLCMLIVIAGGITLAARLGPFWIEHRTLLSILRELPVSLVREGSRGAVFAAVDKGMALNGYDELKARDVLEYRSGRDVTVLTLSYERRAQLLLNVDLVIVFNDSVEFR